MAKEIKQIIKTAVKKYISLNKSMYIHENEIEINEFQPSKENSIHNLYKVLNKEPMRLLNKILMNSNHYHDYCASKKKKCDKNEHRRILIYDLRDTGYMFNSM